tara:strand:- start:197 stop:337 length:141 start_codon:yes stop_codon:yes gene_type:complete
MLLEIATECFLFSANLFLTLAHDDKKIVVTNRMIILFMISPIKMRV